jgi:hypothetical protein
MVSSTTELKARIIYADACQANMTLKAIEADAKGDYDEYSRLMNLVEALHWRLASIRCYDIVNGVFVVGVSTQCLRGDDINIIVDWIDRTCGTECCGCSSVMEDDIPDILTM